MKRTDSATLSVCVSTGSVVVRITAGLWLEPAVPSLPVLLLTDSDVYDNTASFLITGNDVTFAIYCFIIDFNSYFFVELGFALYTLCRRQVHQY